MSTETSVSPPSNTNIEQTLLSCDDCVVSGPAFVSQSGPAAFASPLREEVLVGEGIQQEATNHGGDGGDAEYTAEVEQEVERVAVLPSYRP